jgi:hypothetical protein
MHLGVENIHVETMLVSYNMDARQSLSFQFSEGAKMMSIPKQISN